MRIHKFITGCILGVAVLVSPMVLLAQGQVVPGPIPQNEHQQMLVQKEAWIKAHPEEQLMGGASSLAPQPNSSIPAIEDLPIGFPKFLRTGDQGVDAMAHDLAKRSYLESNGWMSPSSVGSETPAELGIPTNEELLRSRAHPD